MEYFMNVVSSIFAKPPLHSLLYVTGTAMVAIGIYKYIKKKNETITEDPDQKGSRETESRGHVQDPRKTSNVVTIRRIRRIPLALQPIHDKNWTFLSLNHDVEDPDQTWSREMERRGHPRRWLYIKSVRSNVPALRPFPERNCACLSLNQDLEDPEQTGSRETESRSHVQDPRMTSNVVSINSVRSSVPALRPFPEMNCAGLSLNQDVEVSDYNFETSEQYIGTMTLEIDFLQQNNTDSNSYDSDKMAYELILSYNLQVFHLGQQCVLSFADSDFLLVVRDMEAIDLSILSDEQSSSKQIKIQVGLLYSNSLVIFEKAQNSSINLSGKASSTDARQSVVHPYLNFEQLGIGGLNREFTKNFCQVIASRFFPPDIVEQMGCNRVKGMLVTSPPGYGRTVIARKFGELMNPRKTKVASGVHLIEEYEKEGKISKLFIDAEDEQERLGANSGLHVIIIDDLDSIYVYNNITNQLLYKMNGAEKLNNILVIGMTRQPRAVHEALLRCLEVTLEIGLPDEAGRIQILNILTEEMRESEMLADDVDIKELAAASHNFTGADLAGLIRSATSFAIYRYVNITENGTEFDIDGIQTMKVTRRDFWDC